MAPIPTSFERLCGHEYHEAVELSGATMEYCSCGTGAIGRCVNDQRPVCGYHSQLRNDRRLCMECIRDVDARAAQAALDAEYEHGVVPITELGDALGSLSQVREDADRALILLLAAQIPTPLMSDSVRERVDTTRRATLLQAADRHVTERTSMIWDLGANDPDRWTFNAQAFVEYWVRKGRLGSPSSLQLVEWRYGRILGSTKRKQGRIDGWMLTGGSHGSSGTYGTSGTPARYVLADGTLGLTPCGSKNISFTEPRKPITLNEIRELGAKQIGFLPDIPQTIRPYLDRGLRLR